MTVQGDKTSGTATLYNAWGGAVTVAPASTSGFNNGFTVTYDKVPQDACIQIATRISKTGLTNGITLNSTAHSDGKSLLKKPVRNARQIMAALVQTNLSSPSMVKEF
ncbi:type 4 pilus major pilin [Shigella sonnei]|uniref:type 4 pilus major pilin n=1 Tax=Shigella sonnei TaxID=624 RepID=UPI00209679CC|nr:type 4 pilus major pilin [Shigella sonnei]